MNTTDLEYYGKYAQLLISTRDMVLDEINSILNLLTSDSEHAPAEHVLSRIKSSQSLEAKLKKQGFPKGAKSGICNLTDIIGIRIVTHFMGDVYSVFSEIQKSDKWTVFMVKDYISNPKPNGYRSLHVILDIPSSHPDFKMVKAEIQIRTVAMDCWASLEHQLKYKKDIKNAQLIVDELKRCADEIASTDLTMQTIRDMIYGG